MIKAQEALERLRQGNQRFLSDEPDFPHHGSRRREQVAAGQLPFAVILGCSDSRVPAEIVFDCGLGDLFVIRVAGNIVASSLIGSIELAAEQLGVRLVVVLGHTECSAIRSTVDQLETNRQDVSPHLQVILDFVRPTVDRLVEGGLRDDREELVNQAVRANIQVSVEALLQKSTVLRRLIDEDDLLIVGAEYCLESGEVDFFHGLPQPLPE
jgi:carbonic anhydrase